MEVFVCIADICLYCFWWKMKVLWVFGYTAFLALWCRTGLPIAHPFNRLQSPFQYRILLIAMETWGHQGTAPALIFRQFISACHLYSVATRLMASYLSCCSCENLLVVCCAKVLAFSASPLGFNESHKTLLYCSTMWGSLQCSRQAGGHSMASLSRGQTYFAGISNHRAWWLLGTASPNSRYPEQHWSTRVIREKYRQ